MRIDKRVDYLQYTSDVVPRFLGSEFLRRRSPLPFYKACQEYPCGTLMYYGNVNSEKYLIQMPGRACEEYTVKGELLPLKTCFDYGGRVSRLDLAVTAEGNENLEKFRIAVGNDMVLSDRFENDAPKLICSKDGSVETVYVGSLKNRGKKGIFRAYDKGLESGLAANFSRFELEIRRKPATTAARRLNIGHDIGDIIRNVIDIPGDEWWVDMMGAKSEKLPSFKGEPETDPIARRWHWLCEQVAPALAKLILLDNLQCTSNYDRFHDRVTIEIEKARQLDRKLQ